MRIKIRINITQPLNKCVRVGVDDGEEDVITVSALTVEDWDTLFENVVRRR